MDELVINNEKAKKYRRIRIAINAIFILLFLALAVFVLIKFGPYFFEISKDESKRNEFIENIRSKGSLSFWIVLGLQIFQVMFMIIPSGPIVIASGVLFNPFLAVFVCLLGQTIGGIIVYLIIKLTGYRFLALFVDPNKIKNSKFFGNKKQTCVLIFGYLMIPALPKDIVAFIAPFTKVNVLEYALINFISRIPMTIVSVMLGTSLVTGNYVIAIILAIVSGICALLCFIFNKKIVCLMDKHSKQNTVEGE